MRRDRSFRCKMECVRVHRTCFRYPAHMRVPTRCKRGRWARSRQALRVVYVLQQHSVVPGTTLLLLLYHVLYEPNRRQQKSAGLRSDLHSIVIHPSGHAAPQRQRCSHAPIPVQCVPRSVCTSTWSLSRACYVRACCVLSLCVMRVESLLS